MARSMRHRPTLYSFDPDVAVPPSASHLRDVITNGGKVLLLGDSLASEVARAAQCEAARAGLDSNRIVFQRLINNAARDKVLIRNAFSRLKGNASRLTVAVTYGTHFNTADPTVPGDQENAHMNRATFQKDVNSTLQVLDKLAATCESCVVLFLTTSAQHFNTPSGHYAGTRKHAPVLTGQVHAFVPANQSADNSSLYGCRAWHKPPAHESANWWRAANAIAAAEASPHVLPVPLHRISSRWWDAHPGLDIERFCAVSRRGVCNDSTIPWQSNKDRYFVPDCTHHCTSPFLYQAIWWAMSRAQAVRGTP